MRITNNVLAEKIDNLKETMEEVKPEIKKNTEFRQKAMGVMLFLSSVGVFIGGILVWATGKLFGGSKV